MTYVMPSMYATHVCTCMYAMPCMHSCHSLMPGTMHSCPAFMQCIQTLQSNHAGAFVEVAGKVCKHICLHVLTPLLKLHPHPVCFRTHLQQGEGGASYTLEVSYSAATSQQEEEEQCSVESAVLQCLQVLKRKSILYSFIRYMHVRYIIVPLFLVSLLISRRCCHSELLTEEDMTCYTLAI